MIATTNDSVVETPLETAQQNASQLRLAMEAGRLGAWALDLATGHMECSDQCRANFGLVPGSVFTYAMLLAMIHPDDVTRVREAVESALQNRTDYRAEYRVQTPGGEMRWISARGSVTYGPNNEPTQMVGVTQDITEREQSLVKLREAEEHFRALADNIPQLAWMADASGALFWYNQRWYDYTGTTFDQMQGWGWQTVHHTDYVEGVTEKFRTHVASGEPWEDTFPLRGTDGAFRWFLSRAFPTRDASGRVALWCGTNTDITAQRETEAALKRAEGRVRALYELTSRTDISFTEKVDRLLQAGREWLGLELGVLAHIDFRDDIYRIAQIDTPSAAFPVGFQCPLAQTFCSETVKNSRESPPVAVEHAAASEKWRRHPAYLAYGCEAYIATVIWRGAEIWGTISFVSGTPLPRSFTDFDKDMVRLIAQWIGGEVARQESEAALLVQAAQQRRFVREMLASVTEGKLCLCDSPEDDLPRRLAPVSEEMELTATTLRRLRLRTETAAVDLQFPRDRIQDLLTAVGEAGMNAVKHGNGGTAQIYADPARGTVQVWIQDYGQGIREEDLHRATLEKGWSGTDGLGHGFFLMLRTVDRTYLLTGAQGTTVVLEQEMAVPQPAWLQAVGA